MAGRADKIDAVEQDDDDTEDHEREFVRKLITGLKLWKRCRHHICRRQRSCVRTATCQRVHAKGILRWKREVWLPYLRQQYPTVQWGGPPGITEPQLEAALAAEKEAKAREAARNAGKPLPRKRRRKPARSTGLMVRSGAKRRDSNHRAAPSFETPPPAAPQDEAD